MLARVDHQAFGLGLMTSTALMMLIVTVLVIDPADAGFPAVMVGILGATTIVVWRYPALWATILGLVVTLGAAATIFYIAFGVFQPLSPIEFIAGLLFLVGFLFALVGGVRGAILRGDKASPGSAKLRLGALAVIGVASLVSVGAFLATRTTIDPAEASDATVVDMRDNLFLPELTTVPSGGRLLLTNSDAFAHDFTLEEHDLHTYIGPGNDALVDVGELSPGTYTYICSIHFFEGQGMSGTLTVEG